MRYTAIQPNIGNKQGLAILISGLKYSGYYLRFQRVFNMNLTCTKTQAVV